jgi:hypothetical protein
MLMDTVSKRHSEFARIHGFSFTLSCSSTVCGLLSILDAGLWIAHYRMHACKKLSFFFFEGVAGWQSRLLSRLKKLNLMIVGQAALS